MSLGKRIKEIRMDNGLTQEEFAKRIRVSRPFISRIETNKECPSETVLKLICYVFKVDEDWLMKGIGNKRTLNQTVLKTLEHGKDLQLSYDSLIDYSYSVAMIARILDLNVKEGSKEYLAKNIYSIISVIYHYFKLICDNSGEEDSSTYTDTQYILAKIKEKLEDASLSFYLENLDDVSKNDNN
jgi:putative prophage repressor